MAAAGCDEAGDVDAELAQVVPATVNDAELPPPAPAFELSAQQKNELLFPAVVRPADAADRRCVRAGRDTPPAWLEHAVEQSSCTPELRAIVDGTQNPDDDAVRASPQDLLTAAALCNDVAAIARGIERGASPNRRDACGSTALVAAASVGHREAVDALLIAGARPSFPTEQGRWSRAPLLAALIARDSVIAKKILDAGAGANVETEHGRSALMFAVAAADEDLVRDLLNKRADACHADSNGLTPLTIALVERDAEVFGLLAKAWRKCSKKPGVKLSSRASTKRGRKRDRKRS